MAYRAVDRSTFERTCRASARTIVIESHVALCRILEKHYLYVDPMDATVALPLMMDGVWEADITIALIKMLSPGMRVINVGANVGYYAVLFGELVGETGRVDVFEPQENLCRLIGMSLIANDMTDRVVVHSVAAGDRHQIVEMRVNQAASGGAYVEGPRSHLHRGGGEIVQVCQRPLDEVIPDQKTDLILVDTEGHEEAVWDGAQKIIGANPDIKIVFEFTPTWYADPKAFLAKLGSFGHRIMEIDDHGDIWPVEPEQVLNRFQSTLVLTR